MTPPAAPGLDLASGPLFARAFHTSPVAMAISTLEEGRLLKVNASFLRQTGYQRAEVIGCSAHDLGLWADPNARARLLRALRTRSSVENWEVALRTKSGVLRWALASFECIDFVCTDTTGSEPGGRGLISMFQDITERKAVEAALRASEERYHLITHATTDAVWEWDLHTHAVQWSQGLRTLFGYPDEALRHHDWWRMHVHPADLANAEASVASAIERGDTSWSHEYRFRRADGKYAYVLDRGYIIYGEQGRPLRMVGVMVDISEKKEHEQILAQRVHARTRELAILLQISRQIAIALDLEPLLDLILEQAQTVLEFQGASIVSREGERFVGRAYRGSKPREWIFQFSMPVDNFIDRQVIASRQPYLVPDMLDDTPATRYFRASLGDDFAVRYAGVRSWLRIPLIARDEVVGMLSLHHAEPHFFTPKQLDLALLFASQAAVAIANARLYEQARQLAAVEERQRLARELHDSVSQALYGIALGARTARTLLERDPAKVAGPLDYVLQLAEAGMAEMRALIFELRPESLAEEGLVAALAKHAAALRARHQLDVQTNLGEEPELAFEVKEALYRIAQEALHNIVKHAHASRVDVWLARQDGRVVLTVQDNGQGFAAGGAFPGHLGLKSMQERAVRLGGVVQIESTPGQGTRVVASVLQS
jgi:PAS domain S-box-containing protein